MRCKACDYPLWNLTARQCPECGRPFAPSEFQFVPNSVRYLCPHCSQDYYGTSPEGHLVPAQFECVRCHNPIAMDQMVLLPTEGVAEEQTAADDMPWLNRAKRGLFKSWLAMLWRVLFSPDRLARTIPDESPAGPAWGFALFTILLYIAIGFVPIGLLMGFSRSPPAAIAAFTTTALGLFAGSVVAILIWALLAHLILRVTGNVERGLGVTIRTMCYASAASVFFAIPCIGLQFGWLIGWIWPAASAAVMLRYAQKVGVLRAVIAALAGPVLLLVGVAVFVLGLIVPAITSATRAAVSYQVLANQGAIQQVRTALDAYAARNSGQFPIHAMRLVAEDDLLPVALTPPNFSPQTQRPPSILDRYQLLTQAQQQTLVAAMEASAPANAAAHRLGDFVFTYHGVDPQTCDPGVWLVIYDPPTSATNFQGLQLPIYVETVGGGIMSIPRSQFPAALTNQNTLRAGLPQLPDPSTVTESGSGSAGSGSAGSGSAGSGSGG